MHTVTYQERRKVFSSIFLDSSYMTRFLFILPLFYYNYYAFLKFEHFVNSDTVSYIDIAKHYLRGDLTQAISAYWSPLYSVVLAAYFYLIPTSSLEVYSHTQYLGLFFFFLKMLSFEFFLKNLRTYILPKDIEKPSLNLIYALSYASITLNSFIFLQIFRKSPDPLLECFTFTLFAYMMRLIVDKKSTVFQWVTFSLLAALAYTCKAIYFYINLIFFFYFIANAIFFKRDHLKKITICFFFYLLFIGPWVSALSNKVGFLTYGATGKMNWYEAMKKIEPNAFRENNIQSNKIEKALLNKWEVLNFERKNSSYSLWERPYEFTANYYTEKITIIDILKNLKKNLRFYYFHLRKYSKGIFSTHLILFFIIFGGACFFFRKNLIALYRKEKSLLVSTPLFILTPIAIFGAYCLVNVSTRYLSAFLTILLLGLCIPLILVLSHKKRLLRFLVLFLSLNICISTYQNLKRYIPEKNPGEHSFLYYTQAKKITENHPELTQKKVSFLGGKFHDFPRTSQLIGSQLASKIIPLEQKDFSLEDYKELITELKKIHHLQIWVEKKETTKSHLENFKKLGLPITEMQNFSIVDLEQKS